MYKDQLIQWCDSQNIKYTLSENELKTKCPLGTHDDKNPSFSINIITGLGHCFSCQGSIHANRILDIKQDEDTIRVSKYLALDKLWEEQSTPEEPPAVIILPPVDFMIKEDIRGVPKELLMELGVYYCSQGRYQGRLILPIRDKYGNLLGFDARIYEHQLRPDVVPNVPGAKYLRPSAMKTAHVLYPLDYLWNHRKEFDLSSIVLVEGVFDAISYIALGIPALCNFGLGMPNGNKVGHLLALGCQEITNGLDGDAPSIKAWQGDMEKGKEGLKHIWGKYVTIGKSLELTKKIRQSEHKDANDYLKALARY